MKLNHPAVISWDDPTANISIVHQNGSTLEESPAGATFTARFAQPTHAGFIYGKWSVASFDESIGGNGSFTIEIETPNRGDMGTLIDYDGAFEFPRQIAERLALLGYDVSDVLDDDTTDDDTDDEEMEPMTDDDRMDLYDSIEDNNPSGRDLPDRNEDGEYLNGGGYMP